ncbi:porin [Denitrobaculum tricleocarpae]|uniref:Porin n=1 Tax=Denitrobaculum tricleocarpae TaxID=2591009 RepID=A0A545TR51_9PROT|nr:porin [Denitrobaculum tricleocarpae]TQV79699.1 porin [Denitrobaculum tricleocarpae]
MTIGTPGIVSLVGALTLIPNLAWSMDLEELVPGSFFAENRAWNGSTANDGPADAIAFDLQVNRQMLSESQTYGLSPNGSENGVAFFTPRFAGLQGSVGYRPDDLGSDSAPQLGVNWTIDVAPDAQIAAATSYELNKNGFDIGARYAQGPWELQLMYGSSEGETELEEIESLALSAGYAVGPGISFTGVLGAADRNSSAEESKSADDRNNEDFWVVTGVKIRF